MANTKKTAKAPAKTASKQAAAPKKQTSGSKKFDKAIGLMLKAKKK